MSKIIQDKSEITPIINNQISDGENLLRELRSQKLINALESDWELWRMKTAKILESIDSSHAHSFLMVSELNKSFAVKQKVIEFERVLTNAIEFLKRLITDMENGCLLYTSDAADEEDSVDLGGRRIIKKNTKNKKEK